MGVMAVVESVRDTKGRISPLEGFRVVGCFSGSMASATARQALRLHACKGTLLLIFAPMTMSDDISRPSWSLYASRLCPFATLSICRRGKHRVHTHRRVLEEFEEIRSVWQSFTT